MEGKFVSDISDVILNYYNKKQFEEIYNVVDASISDLTTSMNYDSAYRLQQDIAFLNTSMLNEISKYINSKQEPGVNVQSGRERDTFKEQSNSVKTNLVYKYFYLILKSVVIIALLAIVYTQFFMSDSTVYRSNSFDKSSNLKPNQYF